MQFFVAITTRAPHLRDADERPHMQTAFLRAMSAQDAEDLCERLTAHNRTCEVCIEFATPRGMIKLPIDTIRQLASDLHLAKSA